MTFEELIKDPLFDLPIKQPDNKYFDVFMNELLTSFLSKIDELDDGKINIERFDTSGAFVKKTQKVIVTGLLDSIKDYLNGSPYKAYHRLNNVLRNEIKDLYEVIRKTSYMPNNNFYRIRVKNEKGNFAFSPIDLFHIPFSMRGRVSTQRYSIPGFPSLYLSRTLYVCWEELNRPEINKFQAVRLQNKQRIELLDLSPPPKDASSWQHYLYFMTWPLIACCSVKVKDYTDVFRPEYIIPQLLLQWVRDNDEIDGIMYKSNHIEPYLYKESGELYNIVLPVKEISQDKHCNKLKQIFEMTEVVSWQLHEYAIGGQEFVGPSPNENPINKKLPDLELIKGRKYPYSYSILGQLESFLDGMPTKPIV